MTLNVRGKRFGAAWITVATTLLAACGGGGDGNSGLGGGAGAAMPPPPTSVVQKAASPQKEEELPLSRHADGIGQAARFVSPGAMAIDPSGNQFVIDKMPDQDTVIRKITPEGSVSTLTTTVGGGPDNLLRWHDAYLGGIAVDGKGALYVSNYGNATIEKIDAQGVTSVLAGQAGKRGHLDGVGSEALLDAPSAMTADADGTVYFIEDFQKTIRKVAPNGAVTTVAGTPSDGGFAARSGGEAGENGVGADARFVNPTALVVDGKKNLYVYDDRRIKKITPQAVVTILAGSNNLLRPYYLDGEGAVAGFSYQPSPLAVDANGAVYVADRGNNVIRKVTPDGTVSTYAGAQYPRVFNNSEGYSVFAPDLYLDGSAQVARFGTMGGIAMSAQNVLYAVDAGNFVVRKVTPVGDVSTWAGVRSRISLPTPA
ncbi:hypothetical protein [Variovorax sp. PAMC26660]|uniref:hypothetical protein n=1 Tax=Variovorax sp. PAMC26660 TaxID=2762322 RepID=UPI00164D5C77|nr:hypothetical protein [Variovorax sp. PAMC26660]QNK69825.1 hypothetical protein H7F35_09110 [Variovorax sp. PAMC26660]